MGTEREEDLISSWREKFNRMAERMGRYFSWSEPPERGQQYMLGLMSNAERKNNWQVAGIMHEDGAQGMQRLLNAADWDVEAVGDELGQYEAEELGEADGNLIIEETGFLKKGINQREWHVSTAGRQDVSRISKLGSFWPTLPARAAPLLSGNCTSPKNGSKLQRAV